MKIVLASTSKFKSDILSRVHIKHECMGIDYEENSNQSNYSTNNRNYQRSSSQRFN